MVNVEDQNATAPCFSVMCTLYPVEEINTEVTLLSRKEEVKKYK